jgi:hypothetical protein
MAGGVGDAPVPQFFHGNTLVIWGIFTAPRHPLLLRTMQNMVEIIRSIYLRESYTQY